MKLSDFNNRLDSYEQVIIGTPVYYGMINKKVKEFINNNEDKLILKNLHIFFCAMNEPEISNMINANFSEIIINNSNIIHLGGAYYFDDLKFLEKIIVKKIAKVYETTESYKEDEFSRFTL